MLWPTDGAYNSNFTNHSFDCSKNVSSIIISSSFKNTFFKYMSRSNYISDDKVLRFTLENYNQQYAIR